MATLFLILIYASFISLGLPDSLLGVSWPAMQPGLHVPVSFAGILSMVISGGTILSSLMSSRVIKKFGTGKVTFVSVFLTAGALLGFRFSPSFIFLILMSVPLGLGAGAVDSGLNAYVAEHYESRHMSWLHCFWGVGAVLGPLIMSRNIRAGSWRNGYLTVSLIQFGLVAVLFFAIPLWKRVAGATPAAEEDDTPGEPSDQENRRPFSMGLLTVLLTFACYCAAESTMGLWGGSFFVRAKGVDAATAAEWVSFFYFSITVGRLITGFISIKAGNRNLIRAGQLIILAGAALMLLPLPGVVSLAGLILVGFGCAPIFPCMLHETPNRFGKERARSVMGLQMAVAYTGSTLLPPVFGFFSTFATFAAMPLFILFYGLIMLLCSEKANRLFTPRKPAEQIK